MVSSYRKTDHGGPAPVRPAPWILCALSLPALLASCSSPSFLQPGSPIAAEEASLYRLILYMALGVFILVESLLIFAVIRFRARAGDVAPAKQIHGNTRLEVAWTALPFLLVASLFFLTVRTARAVQSPSPAQDDVHIHVVGHQWWWEFEYLDYGFKTANEIHIPVGRAIQVSLDSVDVIHSFWVPQLAGKTDAIPGQTNRLWLWADQPATYHGQCVEFCGLNHANMRIRLVAESPQDFEVWVRGQQAPPSEPSSALEQSGQDLFLNGICANCHTIGDHAAKNVETGPNLSHLFSRSVFAGATFPLNEANLRSWLTDTQAMKPGNDMLVTLTPDEIDALVAYLMRLK